MTRIALVFALTCLLSGANAEPPAFRVGVELPSQVPVTHAVEAALRDIGISYANYYVVAAPGSDMPEADTNRGMIDLCEKLGIDFSIACHHIDPSESTVRDAIQRAKTGKARFRGVVFDELEHCRLLSNYSPTPVVDSSKFHTLEQAHDETLEGYRKLKARFEGWGSPATATHVWPVLNHTAARAGFTVCPKICKEYYSTVSLAIGIGAAKEYGRDLWADCDLWFWDLVPGHLPEEFKSNLLLAYWLGVDLVYVEGSGFNLRPAGKQGIPFSMMTEIDENTYQLTPHGEALRWFCREYVPDNPRKWTFRDIRPSIAIIRYEDTDHGQRYTADWPDNLYGSPNLHSDRDTGAWFGLWNLITFGKTGRDGLSLFKAWVAPSGYQRAVQTDLAPSYLTRPAQADTHRFFVPLNGAVVYDELAGYDLLKGVPLLFLTGKHVSPDTMTAVSRCVEEGAVCVAWGPLAKQNGFADWSSGVTVVPRGKGRFVITDDFGVREVYRQIASLIGRPDEIRYRFGDHEVVLRRVTDNEVRVELVK